MKLLEPLIEEESIYFFSSCQLVKIYLYILLSNIRWKTNFNWFKEKRYLKLGTSFVKLVRGLSVIAECKMSLSQNWKLYNGKSFYKEELCWESEAVEAETGQAEQFQIKWEYRGSPLSTIFGTWKKSYYAKFILKVS